MSEIELDCCAARELAIDLLDGDLDEATARAVRNHVATCPSCPQLYRALVLVRDELRRAGTVAHDRDRALVERLRRRLLSQL